MEYTISMLCKKCKEPIKKRVQIDGKMRNLQSRKYCFTCSPFKSHNTRKIHLETLEKIRICTKCNRTYLGGHKKHKDKCGSCAVSDLRIRRKKEIVEIFGGFCKICGYSKCIGALEFHHLDASKKEMQISGSTRSFEKLLAEANKCILVCNRCHRELHAGLISIAP